MNESFPPRLEQTIGKQGPGGSTEDRAKSTVLARMQRVEGTIQEMGHTMENIFILLKHLDDKMEHLRSRPSLSSVQYSSIDERIP